MIYQTALSGKHSSYHRFFNPKIVYSTITASLGLSILLIAPDSAALLDEQGLRQPPKIILEDSLAGKRGQYPNREFERFIEEVAAASKAETAARVAIQLEPTSVEAHLDLAQALWDLERPQEAKATYQQAIQIDPTSEEAYFAFGEFLRLRNRQADRIELFRAMVAAMPESAIAYAQLADSLTYAVMDDPIPAEKAYRKAISLNPKSIDLYLGLGEHLGDLNGAPWQRTPSKEQLDKAEVVLKEALRLDPESLETYFGLSLIGYLRKGRVTDTNVYREAIEQFPNNVALHEQAGFYLLHWAGRPSEAEALYREAIERGLTSEALYIGLGDVLIRKREYAAAEIAYRAALPLSEEGLAYKKLADLLIEHTDQPVDAISVLEQAIRQLPGDSYFRPVVYDAYPSNSYFFNALGDQLQSIGRTNEAIASYRSAIPLTGSSGSVRDLAELLVEQQRYEEAIDIYERFVFTLSSLEKIDRDTGKTWERALRELGRTAEADSLLTDVARDYAAYRETIYQQATLLSPKTPSFHEKLGNALAQQGKDAEAEVAYQNALALGYQPLHTHLKLAKVLLNQNKFIQAEEAYKTALMLRTSDVSRFISSMDEFNLYQDMGDLYLATDRLPLALEFYQQALEMRPHDEDLAGKITELQKAI